MQISQSIIPISVYSNFYQSDIMLQAYAVEDEPGAYVLLHNNLKAFMLNLMLEQAKHGSTLIVDYTPIETSMSHCIVSCTVSSGKYKVTETGESCVSTLNTTIAKNYPYIEAEVRAFDRAVISFLQLNINGKRFYSDKEIAG